MEYAELYNDDMTMREGREAYFRKSGFSEKAYVEDYFSYIVPVLFLPYWLLRLVGLGTVFSFLLRWTITVRLPNAEGRKADLAAHDFYHVISWWGTSWPQEFWVSAEEKGTAWNHKIPPAGDFFHSNLCFWGFFYNPLALYRAFVKGRRRSNFYGVSVDAYIDRKIGEVRKDLTRVHNGRGDLRAFFAMAPKAAVAALVFSIATIVGFCFDKILLLRGIKR